MRDQLLKHPLLRIPLLRKVFLASLTRARYFSELRDDTRFYATMVLPVLHRTLLEFGRRLDSAGILDALELVPLIDPR